MNLKEAERRILDDPIVRLVTEEASKHKVRLYLVGGAVRDHILGRPHRDYDFIIEGNPHPLLRSLGVFFETKYFPLGRKEKIYRLVKGGKVLDFSILSGKDIMEDLSRRDFTINAIAYSPQYRKFYSHPESFKHLSEKKLVLLSSRAIVEDPLRMLRAFRYKATLNFELSEELKEEILQKRELLKTVSPERILMEMEEILLGENASQALLMMADLYVLDVIFPEMENLRNLQQGENHLRDAFEHSVWVTIWALKLAKENKVIPFSQDPKDLLVIGWSALFHDLGKPETKTIDEKGKAHFYGHESISKIKAEKIMERYPFPSDIKKRILSIIANHMRPLQLIKTNFSEKSLRRLAHEMGEDIKPLLILSIAETEEKEKKEEKKLLLELSRKILELVEKESIIHPPRLLTGKDLLQMGFQPGKYMGQILKEIMQLQIEGVIKNREEAIEYVKKNYSPLQES